MSTAIIAPDYSPIVSTDTTLAQPGEVVSDPTYDDIFRWLKVFVFPDQVIEARFVEWTDNPKYGHHIYAGFFDFDHLLQLAAKIEDNSKKAEGSFFVFNSVDPEMIAKACNRLKKFKNDKNSGNPEELTKDHHIIQRNWIMIDADANRFSQYTGEPLKGKFSATDGEKQLAFDRMDDVGEYLDRFGFPGRVIGDSGNGCHSWCRWKLPMADDHLVHAFLKALHHRFTDEKVKIDTTVGNLSRITKAYGSLVRKGDHTPQRPHRYSRLIHVPTNIVAVERGMIEAVIADNPEPPKTVDMGSKHNQSSSSQSVPSVAKAESVGRTGGKRSVIERAGLYLDECDPSIQGSNGSAALVKVSATGPAFDIDKDEFLTLFAERYNVPGRCDPVWSPEELSRAVDRIYEKEPRRGWLLGDPAEHDSECLRPEDFPAWAPFDFSDIRPGRKIDGSELTEDDYAQYRLDFDRFEAEQEARRATKSESPDKRDNQREAANLGEGLPNKRTDDPHRLSRLFVDHVRGDGDPTLISHREHTWKHDGTRYRQYLDIEKELNAFIEKEFNRVNVEAIAKIIA